MLIRRRYCIASFFLCLSRNRVEHLLNECDEIKRLYLEIRSDRDLTAQNLEEEKKKHLEVDKTNRALEERIRELKQQISDLEDHILSIEEGIQKLKYSLEFCFINQKGFVKIVAKSSCC